jgi:Ca2+-binding EF-hand superfamily protein
MKRHLNIKPELRMITTAEGSIASADLRHALNKMNLDLTEDELKCCCGAADEKINAANFVRSLVVPEYEYGSYNPFGNSSKREISWLSYTQHAWKETMQMQASNQAKRWNQDAMAAIKFPPPNPFNAKSMSWSQSEVRKVSDITNRLERVGVPLFSLVKGMVEDGPGTVKRIDLEESLKKCTNFGMIKDQINELWGQADKQGTNTINFVDLHDAIKATQSKSTAEKNASSVPQVRRSDPGSQHHWADLPTTRSPCLSSCHYNVRSCKVVAPRKTSDTIIPLESSFSYCPDWMRSTSIRLENSWLVDGAGQGVAAKRRYLARLERKREAESRITESVQRRETRAENQDAARLNGIARVRHDWVASMQGIWA